MKLGELFPDEDYRFALRFTRGEPAPFFAASIRHMSIVAQRRHWLRQEPAKYSALLPEGVPLLFETAELAHEWNGFLPPAGNRPLATCHALGGFWEADFLLLNRTLEGRIRLYGGCLCFPSSWRLTDKLGETIEFIHEPVPGLNESIGPGIHKFLAGLKPGTASFRANWGLAHSPELNHHPDRQLPRLSAGVPLEEVWLRVERQALVALPKTGGILFGICVENHPLGELRAEAEAAARFCRALETMPEDMARYKGIADARAGIITQLRA